MEASSTTVNIQGPEPIAPVSVEAAADAPNWFGHTHKYPNFGRFVEGCEACIAKGRPAAKDDVKTSVKAKDADRRIAELEAALAEARSAVPAAVSSDPTRQLVELMLRNEAEKVTKLEEEKARKAAAREQMLQVERERIAQEQHVQAACGHVKENGRSAIAQQQVHNDGYIHPFCQRCGKTFAKRRPSHEEMPTAVAV